MERWLFTFFIGAILSLFLPIVPDFSQLLFCLFFAAIFCLFKRLRSFSGIFFGCAWVLSAGFSYQNIWKANNLTQGDYVGKTITVKGVVANIPTTLSRTVKDNEAEKKVSRFNFIVDEINEQKLTKNINIRLRWDDKPLSKEISSHVGNVKQGQQWQLKVRIKPAHGFANIGGFSYQTWLRQKELHATGYVKHSIENKVIDAQPTYRQKLYLQLNEIVSSLVSKSQRHHFIFALTFGERGKITADQWQVLQATGTQHLMAISGLHLGLIASGAFGLMVMCFRFIPIHLLFSEKGKLWLVNKNSRIIAFFFSSLVAIFYAYLAGFSLPTLRALIMMQIFIGSKLLAVKLTVTRWLLLSIVCIILLSPFSLFSVSFWLSVYAVTLILLIIWRCRKLISLSGNSKLQKVKAWLSSLIIVQLGLTLFMLPVAAMLNHQLPLSALLANIIAVPWMSFTAIPLCLLSVVVMPFSEAFSMFFLELSLASLDLIWQWLSYLSHQEGLFIDVSHKTLMIILLMSGLIFISYFLALPKKTMLIAVLFIFPLTSFYLEHQKKNNDWQVNVLDVGQGLSVVIERNGQVILYDTGASYPSGFNLAESVIFPYFQYRGIEKIDYLILSHADNDHAGGLSFIDKQVALNKMSVDKIKYNESSKITKQYSFAENGSCKQGDDFTWQGLTFSVLWPVTIQENENDNSCVINISDGKYNVLLTGDVSRKVEKSLTASLETAKQLKADVIIAPHHGSKTSSTSRFIKAVSPDAVIFSAGFLNRWHMPNKAVLKRYEQFNVTPYSTAEQGMIQIKIEHQGLEIESYREHINPYWFAN
ncbi:MAG: DNA internalization-related competence protein ComEC/Rec2 [Colwellia sp.]|nr:DNA internalization-related competence protein ComEC/Rec2 [Colwellia sp.]